MPTEGEPAALLEGPMGKLDGAPFRGTEAQIRVPVGCHVLETNRGMVVATTSRYGCRRLRSPLPSCFIRTTAT